MYDLICIDIGNSSIHLGYFENGVLIQSKNIPTQVVLDFPREILPLINKGTPISYCNVVPCIEKEMQVIFKENNNPFYPLSHQSYPPLPISYPKRSEIGSDRIANSIAAFSKYNDFSIVVDIGTATTFDLISPLEGYCGGIIAPGPQGFLDFLHNGTALLPKLSLNDLPSCKSQNVGKSTESAMFLGVLNGFNPMVLNIIEALKSEIPKHLDSEPNIILVGGASKLLDSSNFILDPYLTLNGLAIAFDYHLDRSTK